MLRAPGLRPRVASSIEGMRRDEDVAVVIGPHFGSRPQLRITDAAGRGIRHREGRGGQASWRVKTLRKRKAVA